MINFDKILKQEFEIERQLDISEFTNEKHYVTIKKIPRQQRIKIESSIGQEVKAEYLDNGELKNSAISYNENFDDILYKKWKLLFEYGLDKQKHSLLDDKGKTAFLNIKEIEGLALISEELVKFIENEIVKFNGIYGVKDEKKKKK